MSTSFDTLKLADRLAAGGFTAEQAKTAASALAEALTADLATKADLGEVRLEIAELKAELIKWLVGAIGFQTVVILGALVTLLKPPVK